jgi:hypothetical protein
VDFILQTAGAAARFHPRQSCPISLTVGPSAVGASVSVEGEFGGTSEPSVWSGAWNTCTAVGGTASLLALEPRDGRLKASFLRLFLLCFSLLFAVVLFLFSS